MAQVTRNGKLVHTEGDLPTVGTLAPPFVLTNADMEDVGLNAFAAKATVLNILHSLDTPVCAASARRFHGTLGTMQGVVVLNISADLPFAQKRFCADEKLSHLTNLSTFRSPSFGADFGVRYIDGPLAGLMSRAVLVLDEDHKVVHAQQVSEVSQEPDYDAVLEALKPFALEKGVPAEASVPDRQKTVLILDDESSIRDLMRSVLSRLGYDVTATCTGDEAIAAYRKQLEQGRAFDLVIVDLRLGDEMGGTEVLASLKTMNPKVTVVACSGSFSGSTADTTSEDGFAAFLSKPFQVGELRSLVARFLGATH